MYKKITSIFQKGEKGQAALTFILALMGSMTILVSSLGVLTFNEVKKLNNITKSAQSFYAAEAGIEDALNRVINRLNYPAASYPLPVGNGSTQVEISGPLSALVITSEGNVNDRIRKVVVNLSTSATTTNVSFNFGVQVGYGGLVMENNAIINGNVYSNGSIQGANGAQVTGSAIVAIGTSLTADQQNDVPTSPPSEITFGNASSSQDAAQSFSVSVTNPINKISLYIKKVGNPNNATVRITGDSGGNPGTTTIATGTLNNALVTNSFGWVDINLSPNPQLNAGTTYWLVIDGSSNASKYWVWGANTNYASGEAKTGKYSGGPWNATGLDGYFKIFLGGITTFIDSLNVGTGSGDNTHANTVTNTTAVGDLLCQIGSGNNKPCDTSQPDPSPQDMPLSEANIDQWKAEAEAGGTITGDYTPPADSSLGPKKITGDLNLSLGQTLTLTGTVWVEGNIDMNNNATVDLDSAYGAEGGIFLSDGWIHIRNNSQFLGSGDPDSYILVLSTSDCDGSGTTGSACTHHDAAVDVHNNAGTAVLYTADGLLYLHQVIGVKQATAYKLHIENNAHIDYESGLANANFSSGPGGGFIINSWQEVE